MNNKAKKTGLDDFLDAAGANKLEAKIDETQLSRPLVMLSSDNGLMSECAAELGGHLHNALYLFNGEVVALEGRTPQPISPQAFRTLVEDFAICTRRRVSQKVTVSLL